MAGVGGFMSCPFELLYFSSQDVVIVRPTGDNCQPKKAGGGEECSAVASRSESLGGCRLEAGMNRFTFCCTETFVGHSFCINIRVCWRRTRSSFRDGTIEEASDTHSDFLPAGGVIDVTWAARLTRPSPPSTETSIGQVEPN